MKYNNEGTIHVEYILNKILMYSWFKKLKKKKKNKSPQPFKLQK